MPTCGARDAGVSNQPGGSCGDSQLSKFLPPLGRLTREGLHMRTVHAGGADLWCPCGRCFPSALWLLQGQAFIKLGHLEQTPPEAH